MPSLKEISGDSPKHKGRFLSLFLMWQLDKEPNHGYALIEIVKGLGISPCKQSTVYSVLSKLEKADFIESQKKEIDQKFRKVYRTTKKGRDTLANIKKNRIRGKLREFMEFLLS